jgi:hypothetical protein
MILPTRRPAGFVFSASPIEKTAFYPDDTLAT